MSGPHISLTEEQRLQKALHEARTRHDGFAAVYAHLANAPSDANIAYLRQWQATKDFLDKRIAEASVDVRRLQAMLDTRTALSGNDRIARLRRAAGPDDQIADQEYPSQPADEDDIPSWMK